MIVPPAAGALWSSTKDSPVDSVEATILTLGAGCYGGEASIARGGVLLSLSPDVLIIGGGIVGAASAYHLARRGADVLLLEAEQLAFGATGRNLGYIWVHKIGRAHV